ncbi:MAG: class I adenylate-forming enzyme family protein [Acidimicrobiales bacterium]|nr:class I adenylate-forming enzyme family protein [Acidimicrobiales bacterium]
MTTDTAQETATSPARLEWRVPDDLPEQARAGLMGPGAPFEMAQQVVAGYGRTVFPNAPRTLRQLFETTVARQPDAPMLVDAATGRSWTATEVRDEVDAMARYLAREHGVSHGDRVGIVAANSPEYGFVMLATLSLGAIITSLNGWWTGPEIVYGIQLTSPKVVLGDERRLERLAGETEISEVPTVLLTAAHAAAEALDAADVDPVNDADPDDPAVILFTSGTTGRPKGATLSHRNIVHFGWMNMLSGAVEMMRNPSPSDDQPATPPASILASPMFHVSGMLGMLMTAAGMGVKSVFPPPGRWSSTEHIRLTAKHRITTWSGVPTQWWRILHDPELEEHDLTCVTNAGGGGAVFPPELVREFQEKMPWATLGNGYGMSETVGAGTRIGGELMIQHPDSVGPANPTMEIEIRDGLSNPLPEGAVGEIHLRGTPVFLGYWDNGEATRACMDGEGWYASGDYGRIEKGLLYLESRMRDMILRGGENIYPIEIENRLVEHPDIDDAAVIGVDHVELGQEVKAFVLLRDGASMAANDVKQWVAEGLAAFKVPAHVEFRDSLPYTETGKVLKHELEAEERAQKS